MLRQRLITALVLIPAIVLGILLLDNPVLALLLGAVVLAAALEMGRLAQLQGALQLGGYALLIALAMVLAWRYLSGSQLAFVQALMTLWWVLVTVLLVMRTTALRVMQGPRIGILLLGGLVLLSAWISIVSLHAIPGHGPVLVLFLFVLIWVADSGAYFAGRAFGRRKLSPMVSPGKTWAGAGGAAAGAVTGALLFAVSGLGGDLSWSGLVLLSLLVMAVSIGGDLWESRLKREAGVKDSGALLPGHGGMLDRIDSLIAAAPVFALGVALLGAGA